MLKSFKKALFSTSRPIRFLSFNVHVLCKQKTNHFLIQSGATLGASIFSFQINQQYVYEP